MKMPYNKRETLEQKMRAQATPEAARFISDSTRYFLLSALNAAKKLRKGKAEYAGRNVMLRTNGQLSTVLAALALDGLARRILLCPVDVPDTQIPRLMQEGEAELIITDTDIQMEVDSVFERDNAELPFMDTEWILFTSGTSGVPKLVQHSFASLIAPLSNEFTSNHPIWSTFYDIRRYGGLQILLRALVGGGSMVLSAPHESVVEFIARLGNVGITHISGTPSHWRRVLMSGEANKIAPFYIRLSGEMVGQDILDCLHSAYPMARIGHAYASTEAGVAFSVDDGQAGFPQSVLNAQQPKPTIRVANGSLHVRSNAMASRYLGSTVRTLVDADGFIDTGDMVERQANRFVFIGRREGVVNVGGLKVYPEEVEATINMHPEVAMSRVWGRPSPIVGTLIAADIVLMPNIDGKKHDIARICNEVISTCRSVLAPYKVPVRIHEVAEIRVMKSGKIERHYA